MRHLTTNQKVAGSSPAERAPLFPANHKAPLLPISSLCGVDHLFDGFRRKVSSLALGLVREIAKVGARTDTSGHPVESIEPLLLQKIGPVTAKKQGGPDLDKWR